ncbi:acyloxyacyl hydrolase [Polaribacter porphyrae]|uniref:acyloxyacyl hydrolase n=1 Tax=Polaribacter porphyrae TaxID=1137780 RepID=UPI000CF3BBBC|nr:acyloxyacyl hydrolase [Polaribacter porphyrae]
MKNTLLFLIISFSFLAASGQDKVGCNWKPKKLGFLYNYGSEDNFLFNDKDYTYTTNTYKFQAFYDIASWRKFKFDLIVQPQIQFLKHQLLNKWYVTPNQSNVQEKIDEFTKLKSMSLYGLEFAFVVKRELFKNLEIQAGISLGFSYIDTRTERLAKGFTFIENFSLGFSYQTFKNSFIYLGTNFGHVSNLNFTKPNDGYNVLGIEIGYSFLL